MVVGRPERALEAVRVAGFLQQLARLGRVIGPRAELDRVLDALGQHAFGRDRVARERHLDQGVLVDRVVDGLAHLRVVERLLQHVHRQVAVHDGRRGRQLDTGLGLEDLGLLVGHGEGEVGLARLHDGAARVVVNHRAPGDRVHLGITLAPVAGELLDLEVVALLPLDELERAGADRALRDALAELLERRRRDDHGRRMGQRIDEGRERFLEREAHGVRIDDLGLDDVLVQVVALELVVGVGDTVEVDLHRLGIEIRAVMELDAVLELHRVDQAVLADGVALGQHRHHLHRVVETVQALVEGLHDRLRQGVVGIVRVHRGEGRGDGDDHVLGGESRRGNGGRQRKGGGKRCEFVFHWLDSWVKKKLNVK